MTGAVIGTLTDYGIDDRFITQLGGQLKPGTSALFLYVLSATTDAVTQRSAEFQPTVLHTSLTAEAEDKLRHALSASPAGS